MLPQVFTGDTGSPARQETTRTLSRIVLELCEGLAPSLAEDSRGRLAKVIDRLGGPLQLAVAGRIKSGKSTVVNALIGRRVSPTDIRECTRMVTRFQYGTVDRVEVRKRDGSSVTLPFDADGLVPSDLGCDPSEVVIVDAFLTNEVLRHVTVIDTPGLASLDVDSVERTKDMLGSGQPAGRPGSATFDQGGEFGPPSSGETVDSGSRDAVASAEAVLYVITQSIRADDAAALGAFQNTSNPQASSPINAVAVLNKADQVVADDPFVEAQVLAGEHAKTLRHRVSDVLPLVGLVAEATETGLFTESDADTLRAIAAMPPDQRQFLFFSADFFVRPEVGVPVFARGRLLERLDLYGIRRAVELLAENPKMSTGELRRRLVESSGFPVLRGFVDDVFRRRADGIKASVGLAALELVASQAGSHADRERIRDAVEMLMQEPEAHQLRLLEAAALVTSGTVQMPEDMEGELTRLITESDPTVVFASPGASHEELVNHALDAAGRWRSFATFGSTPAQSRIAHVVHRGFFLLWQQLRARTAGAQTDGGAQ